MTTTPQIAPASKGFFGSLFDFSFTSLVATRVIRVLYILVIVVTGLALVAALVTAIAGGSAEGIVVTVIFAPLIALLYVVFARVLLEVIIAIFRLLETNREIAFLSRRQVALLQQEAGPQPPYTPPAA